MDQPAVSSDSHARVNASIQPEVLVNDDHTSMAAQAQLLLTALRNVVLPLVQTAVPNSKDSNAAVLGSEAEDFLVALQKYISCIIRDQSQSDIKGGRMRMVDVKETFPTMEITRHDVEKPSLDEILRDKAKVSSSPLTSQNEQDAEEESVIPNRLDDLDPPRLDHALIRLREYVFNEMPMRLLCFEQHGPKLNIVLLERNEIYSHLESKLMDEVKTQPLELATTNFDVVRRVAKYAILSHTWLRSTPGEVTYNDWNQGDSFEQTHSGYQKLVNFCRVASGHRLTLGWMDTICINKESSSELDESIRSMYKWYQKANICIAYLAETHSLPDMSKDPWFTRGWTLQELLAPLNIKFYGTDWKALDPNSGFGSSDIHFSGIQRQIELATTIAPKELTSPLNKVPISRKMQWAAKRQVTRGLGEDTAYSLMGIFNVNMSIAYGEGAKRAFVRLIKEILETAKFNVLDVFNWAGEAGSDVSTLLASSPDAYLQRYTRNSSIFARANLMEPVTLTHLGLRIPILLLPAVPASLSTPTYAPIGDYYASLDIEPIWPDLRFLRGSYNILDSKVLSYTPGFGRLAFGILNCGGDESNVHIQSKHMCFGVAFLYFEEVGKVTPLGAKIKIATEKPIFFQLKNKNSSPVYHILPRNELTRHGMQLLTMYL